MKKLPIQDLTYFNEDTGELEFPQHTGVDFYWEQTKSKEIGNVAGVSVMVNPETYEDIKKQKTIYENKILKEQDKEIERLNNIINTFEEWLETEERKCKNYATNDYEGGYVDAINTIIVKLKELKEGK